MNLQQLIDSISSNYKVEIFQLTELCKLPNQPGIYYVFASGNLVYVGRCNNLLIRWKRHHRINQFKTLDNAGFPVVILAEIHPNENELEVREQKQIFLLTPTLNNSPSFEVRKVVTENQCKQPVVDKYILTMVNFYVDRFFNATQNNYYQPTPSCVQSLRDNLYKGIGEVLSKVPLHFSEITEVHVQNFYQATTKSTQKALEERELYQQVKNAVLEQLRDEELQNQ